MQSGKGEVDPRVRGEAHHDGRRLHSHEGRSPRARGSRSSGICSPAKVRSIPACAGKPQEHEHRSGDAGVDPRVRGEAYHPAHAAQAPGGRSPRARGSPRPVKEQRANIGSIPACAGKPYRPALQRSDFRVDPRVRGEATNPCAEPYPLPGRSPRARGSQVRAPEVRLPKRSIPACAGKPGIRRPGRHDPKVDPRVRGEAQHPGPCPLCYRGRSPRARGSPLSMRDGTSQSRSIPACAGKPLQLTKIGRAKRVDPRVRGEARTRRDRRIRLRGRSPRARGSPITFAKIRGITRSIPACAGKPELHASQGDMR